MTQRHSNTLSHGRKSLPAHAKPSKPPTLKRGNSYAAGSRESSRSRGGAHHFQEEDDIPSFLQFCATCERQLVAPGATMLYCSEACRRKDVSKSLTSLSPLSPLSSMSGPSYFDSGTADIVPLRSPTIMRPVSLTFSDISLDDSEISSEEHRNHDESDFDTKNVATRSGDSALPARLHSPTSGCTRALTRPDRPMPSRANKSYSTYSSKSISLVTPCLTPDVSPESTVGEEACGEFNEECQTSRRHSAAKGSLKQLLGNDVTKSRPSTHRTR